MSVWRSLTVSLIFQLPTKCSTASLHSHFSLSGGWQCSGSCTLPGEDDWRWQRTARATQEPDLSVTPWQRSLNSNHVLIPEYGKLKNLDWDLIPCQPKTKQIYHLLLRLPHLLHLMPMILADSYFKCLLGLELCSFLWAWRPSSHTYLQS